MERAVARFGEDEVIARLRISRTSLRAYLCGYRPVCDDLLLRAIDLAVEIAKTPDSTK